MNWGGLNFLRCDTKIAPHLCTVSCMNLLASYLQSAPGLYQLCRFYYD